MAAYRPDYTTPSYQITSNVDPTARSMSVWCCCMSRALQRQVGRHRSVSTYDYDNAADGCAPPTTKRVLSVRVRVIATLSTSTLPLVWDAGRALAEEVSRERLSAARDRSDLRYGRVLGGLHWMPHVPSCTRRLCRHDRLGRSYADDQRDRYDHPGSRWYSWCQSCQVRRRDRYQHCRYQQHCSVSTIAACASVATTSSVVT